MALHVVESTLGTGHSGFFAPSVRTLGRKSSQDLNERRVIDRVGHSSARTI